MKTLAEDKDPKDPAVQVAAQGIIRSLGEKPSQLVLSELERVSNSKVAE